MKTGPMLALMLALAGCGPSTTAETAPQPSREGRFVTEGDQTVVTLLRALEVRDVRLAGRPAG